MCVHVCVWGGSPLPGGHSWGGWQQFVLHHSRGKAVKNTRTPRADPGTDPVVSEQPPGRCHRHPVPLRGGSSEPWGGLRALGGWSRSPRGGSRSPRTRRCPAPAASPRRRRHRLSKRNLSGPGQSQTGPATQPMAAEASESRPMGEPPAACRPMGALYSNGPHLYQRNVGSSQAQVECPVLVPPRRGQPGPPHQALPVAVLPPGAVATPRPACQAPRGPVAPLRGRRVMGRPSRRPRGARL